MKKKAKKKKVRKHFRGEGSPKNLLDQLLQKKCKALTATAGEDEEEHSITMRLKNGMVVVTDEKYKDTDKVFVVKGTMAPEYDPNDKEHRRILLHRIWRWSLKTKWETK